MSIKLHVLLVATPPVPIGSNDLEAGRLLSDRLEDEHLDLLLLAPEIASEAAVAILFGKGNNIARTRFPEVSYPSATKAGELERVLLGRGLTSVQDFFTDEVEPGSAALLTDLSTTFWRQLNLLLTGTLALDGKLKEVRVMVIGEAVRLAAIAYGGSELDTEARYVTGTTVLSPFECFHLEGVVGGKFAIGKYLPHLPQYAV